jgi:hypothetical protein
MTKLFALSLGFLALGFAAPASAQQRYTDIARVPGAWRSGAIATAASNAIRQYGFYQPSSLTVNVGGGSKSGSGVVGSFNSISSPGATVNVQRGGTTSFSLPTGIANRQLGTALPANLPPGVTIQRSDVGGQANFTITSK